MNKIVVEARLQSEDDFLADCVKELYKLQEEDEKAVGETNHTNGVGFNKADSVFLSRIARSLQKVGSTIPKFQLPEVRRRMTKYAGQLSGILPEYDT